MRIPTFCLFMLMVVFSPLAIDIFLPAVPQMAQSLDAPIGSVQAIVAIFVLCMGFGQLIAGPLSDRYGRRPIALAGIVIYLVAAVGSALATTVELLWLMRAIQGLGTCAIVVAAYSGVRDRYTGTKLAAIYSYLNGVICVIPALAPMLGGVLTETIGWRANFWFMFGYAIVAGLLIWRLLPETRPNGTQSAGKLISWAQYQPVLTNSVFQFYAGLVALSFTIILAYVSYSTEVLMVQMEQTPMAFSLWFGSNAAINIAGAFIAPTAIKRLGRHKSLMVGTVMSVVAGLALVLVVDSTNPMSFMLPVYVSSLGFCLLLAVGTGAAMTPFGERAGTASALLGVLQMSGSALLLGLISLLPVSPMACLAVSMVLPAIWWLMFRNRSDYGQVQTTFQHG
ncbi:multidrug effflux MFS transporter [Ferrimonas lipolytica]|uniref:Bcr/CflA family efflux transporter n=1 Tax=Ferrimonas lipolytica TaxID=2724191 RepID=A0A6H1UCY1_9GAMM|nr:multidrug effflux MFS transporter [Ferrimonas lipolytica]QIZ75662.1 multidrug effflux MFS transporter [Ferrimonas lipolytica]